MYILDGQTTGNALYALSSSHLVFPLQMTEEPFHAFAFDGVLGLGPMASGWPQDLPSGYD